MLSIPNKTSCLIFCLGWCLLATGLTGCQTIQTFGGKRTLIAEAQRWEQGGREAMSHGRLDQAKTMLERAAENSPKNRRILEQLADVFVLRGENEKAIYRLEHALEVSNNDPELRVKLGQILLQNGQMLPAQRQVQLALETNRNLASVWELNGDILRSKGELSRSLAAYQRALSLDPVHPGVQIKAVELHRKMRQPMRALSCVEQLLSTYPQGQQPENLLLLQGEVLLDLGQYEPAIDRLKVAAGRPGAGAEVHVQLCRAQLLAGQSSQARLTLAKAAEIVPEPSKLKELLDDLQITEQSRLAMLDSQR